MSDTDSIAQLQALLQKLAPKDRAIAQDLLEALTQQQQASTTRLNQSLDLIHDIKNIVQMILPTLEQELPIAARQVITPQLSRLKLQLDTQHATNTDTLVVAELAEAFRHQYKDAVNRSGLLFTIDYTQRVAQTQLAAGPVFQIVNNLVINAIENSRVGCIQLHLDADEKGLLLTVRDEGFSIAEPLSLPTDPLNIQSQRKSSRGLRSLVSVLEAHNWQLTLAPDANGGTLARLIIPKQKPVAGAHPEAVLKNQTLLIAHHNHPYAEWLKAQLLALGASVVLKSRLAPTDITTGYTQIWYANETVFGEQLRRQLANSTDAHLLSPTLDAAICPCSPLQIRELAAVQLAVDSETTPPTPLNLLIVEDDQFTAMAIRQQLAGYAVTVHHASSGLAALQLAQQHRSQVILLDWQLQDVAAEEVVRRIRKLDTQVQIVVLSGYDAPPALPKSVRAWLTKPLSIERLWTVLNLRPARQDAAPETPTVESPSLAYRTVPTMDVALTTTADSLPANSNPQFAALLLPLLNEMQFAIAAGRYTEMLSSLKTLEAFCKRMDWPAMHNRLSRFRAAASALELEKMQTLVTEMQHIASHWLWNKAETLA